jgi:hypothetical protein
VLFDDALCFGEVVDRAMVVPFFCEPQSWSAAGGSCGGATLRSLSVNEASLQEDAELVARNDDVVDELDAEQPAGLLQPLRQRNVVH